MLTLREAHLVNDKVGSNYYAKLFTKEQTYFSIYVAQVNGVIHGGRSFIHWDINVQYPITKTPTTYKDVADAVIGWIRNVYIITKKNNLSDDIQNRVKEIWLKRHHTSSDDFAELFKEFLFIEHVPEKKSKKSKTVKEKTPATTGIGVAKEYEVYPEPKLVKCVDAEPFTNLLTVGKEYTAVGERTMFTNKENVTMIKILNNNFEMPFEKKRFEEL